jgi:hypothetical protein
MRSAAIVNLDEFRARRTAAEKPPPPPPQNNSITVAEAIDLCFDHPEVLTTWEQGFLSSLRRFPRLSVKQHQVLVRIFDKICGAAEGRAP